MAFRLSTGLRNALLDQKAVATTLKAPNPNTISFGDGDGTGSTDTINDSGSGLGSYKPGDKITVETTTGTNDGSYEILTVAAGKIEIAAGSITTAQASGANTLVILASANGGSFVDLFRNCVIRVYSGAQPASADSAETGTELLEITESGGSFTGGVATNGLNFGEVDSGVLSMESGETWQGDGLAAGTAGWFRCYANAYTTGASTSAVRFDGAVASSGSQFNMSNTTVTVGGTSTVDSVSITLPAS